MKTLNRYQLQANFAPAGDQPQAIEALSQALKHKKERQTLLGVTGSGKTFTAANVIKNLGLPTLVIAHNKTLAGQLYEEFKELFPNNAVEYFISYYDYYQPEAYVPTTDTYIAKDASINDAIDRMRHSATRSLFERNDVIIVASVSCIYGLGSKEAYENMVLLLHEAEDISREATIRKLIDIQYERHDLDFHRGSFRVRGDILEVFPAYEEEKAIRLSWFGETLEEIAIIDPLRGKKITELEKIAIYPSTHYVVDPRNKRLALENIKAELQERLTFFRDNQRLVEAQRLEERTNLDLEMLSEAGHCPGIENYSRHLNGGAAGDPPQTLMDYFPKDFLVVIDESHQTIPQISSMYKGDLARKMNLVEYGFRLPSALDNRPLKFQEFDRLLDRILYISATPAPYELSQSKHIVVEQIIRPTGLVDPEIEIRPAKNQIDDLLEEIKQRTQQNERVLITTLTKRMAEDLTEFYTEAGIQIRYMHSDIVTLQRALLIHDLRAGAFSVLVGINLLREGLDLPEVSLVAILDADKEGFLRSERSLIQTIGRAARNIRGKAILYADIFTESMRKATEETERRRQKQLAFNLAHGITPKTITKEIRKTLKEKDEELYLEKQIADPYLQSTILKDKEIKDLSSKEVAKLLKSLEKEMLKSAKKLDFEKAAILRDQLKKIQDLHVHLG